MVRRGRFVGRRGWTATSWQNEDYILVQGETVFDDESGDILTGAAGTDWFFAGTADHLTSLSDLERLFIAF